jgi:hypothetical protein
VGKEASFQEDGKLDDARWQFAAEFTRCMICGKAASDTHEIPRGVHRKGALKHREAWLRLCRSCHNECGDYSKWPIAKQYAVKKDNDPRFYNRILLNRLRGRADEAISEEEVNQYAKWKTRF